MWGAHFGTGVMHSMRSGCGVRRRKQRVKKMFYSGAGKMITPNTRRNNKTGLKPGPNHTTTNMNRGKISLHKEQVGITGLNSPTKT
jgi:hypothetical protein